MSYSYKTENVTQLGWVIWWGWVKWDQQTSTFTSTV